MPRPDKRDLFDKACAAIASPDFAYARARKFIHYQNDWDVTIYHRDPTYPKGVRSAGIGWLKELEPVLDKYKRPFPLSPTEY